MAATRSAIPLTEIVATCEKFYARDGFVKWADVAAVHGLSRQAIQLRLKAATERGDLEPGTIERWASMSARAAATRESEKRQRERQAERQRLLIRTELTPENIAWLRAECVFRKLRTNDVINGLINKARENKE
jgi:hypothetical protein